MTDTETDKKIRQKGYYKDKAEEVANTLEWLITAFILAFVFRAFVMEAFRIPTGSMADTLMGAHFRLRCLQCGYEYEYGFMPDSPRYRMPRDKVPVSEVRLAKTRCPSCGNIDDSSRAELVTNGDRLLVLKCIYQFAEPKRWDVVVFKNPLEPRINFIKRMIGKPGERVEIIDGDIYIDGQIARKPHNVQEELWMPVYLNDYQPARPQEGNFNGHPWRNPFITAGSEWVIDHANPVCFKLDSPADQVNALVYNPRAGNDFRCTYAYNDVDEFRFLPMCSDLMVSFYVQPGEKEWGTGVSLSKYQTTYRAWVDFGGSMKIYKVSGGVETQIENREFEPVLGKRATRVRFANVDHQLIFEFGDQTLTSDLGSEPVSVEERKAGTEPRVEILGSGRLSVSHVSIFRDIYYTDKYLDGSRVARAGEDNSLKLGEDQFFVLGDNSPNSDDSRWWGKAGVGNNGIKYDEGIVPRDYLVGKAVFVYWPGGFRPSFGQNYFPFALIPNVGRMRFVAGG
jgi:signal peptidase I